MKEKICEGRGDSRTSISEHGRERRWRRSERWIGEIGRRERGRRGRRRGRRRRGRRKRRNCNGGRVDDGRARDVSWSRNGIRESVKFESERNTVGEK